MTHVKPRRTCVSMACYFRLYFSDDDRLTRFTSKKKNLTDIVPLFKVTEKDTCLFVRISHIVLYSNSVLSVVDRIE